jgi:hypothetical protein
MTPNGSTLSRETRLLIVISSLPGCRHRLRPSPLPVGHTVFEDLAYIITCTKYGVQTVRDLPATNSLGNTP